VQSAYSSKEFIFSASVDQTSDSPAASIMATIMAAVNANNVRGFGIFDLQDFASGGGGNAWGLYDYSGSARTTRTSAYTANLPSTSTVVIPYSYDDTGLPKAGTGTGYSGPPIPVSAGGAAVFG
jgi:hypothetical protein